MPADLLGVQTIGHTQPHAPTHPLLLLPYVPARPVQAGGKAPEPAQALGAPMVDELLQDSFLRRLSDQFFQMLHEERRHVSPELAEQVGRRQGAAAVLTPAACCTRSAVATELPLSGGSRRAAACVNPRAKRRMLTSDTAPSLNTPCSPAGGGSQPRAAARAGVGPAGGDGAGRRQ